MCDCWVILCGRNNFIDLGTLYERNLSNSLAQIKFSKSGKQSLLYMAHYLNLSTFQRQVSESGIV